MKKAVIYSCHLEGRNEPDNEMQIQLCREYARQHDIEIVSKYIDCVATKHEPLYMKQLLFEDCKRKEWDTVLFSSITILGRNLDEIMKFLSVLSKYVDYIFIDQENNEVLKTIGFLFEEMYKRERRCLGVKKERYNSQKGFEGRYIR